MKFISLFVVIFLFSNFQLSLGNASCEKPQTNISILCVNGTCDTNLGVCNCNPFYMGINCSISYEVGIPGWIDLFYFYVGLALVLNLILIILSLFQLILVIKENIASEKRKIVIIILILIIFACLDQILYYSIDPNQLRNIYPKQLKWFGPFLFDLYIVILIIAGYTLLLYWLKIAYNNRVLKNQYFKTIQIGIIVILILASLLSFPLAIWEDMGSPIGGILYVLDIIFFLIIWIGLTIYFGKALKKYANSIPGQNGEDHFQILNSLLKYLYGGCVVAVITCFTLIVFAIIKSNPWGYLVGRCIIQVEEFFLVGIFLLVLRGRRKRDTNSNVQTENSESYFKKKQEDSTEEVSS